MTNEIDNKFFNIRNRPRKAMSPFLARDAREKFEFFCLAKKFCC